MKKLFSFLQCLLVVAATTAMVACDDDSPELKEEPVVVPTPPAEEPAFPEDVPGLPSKDWYKGRVCGIALNSNVPLVQLAYKTPERYFAFESAQFDFVTATEDCSTVYQACSVSKVVFSYCVMRLIDRGIIDLDKPLWEYLGYVEDRFQNVSDDAEKNAKNVEYAKMLTARIVLTHRTALPNWAANGGPNTAKLVFKEQPDLSYNYSGEGIWYLQRVIEHITGMGLEAIAQQECFVPLGMTSTSYAWQPEYAQLAAYGYSADLVRSGQASSMQANAAYSMRTNVKDFSLFIEALMEGKGLSREIHQEMFRPQSYLDEEGRYFGLGIRINPNAGQECGPVYVHSGSNFNFRCRFWIFPKLKTYFVYFTNSANGGNIHPELVNLFMPNYTGTAF